MKLLILDRDGVINQDSEGLVKSPEEWQPIPGSLEAISALNQAGYRVVIASNQSGLARGLFDIDTLNAIHRRMHDELEKVGGHLDGIYFCPHRPSDNCSCRKPKPGMLEQICKRFFSDPSDTPFIGDSMRDIEAARTIGAKPILVLTGQGVKTRKRLRPGHNIPVFKDLADAAADLTYAQDTRDSRTGDLKPIP